MSKVKIFNSRLLVWTVAVVFAISSAGCGTLMHSNRMVSQPSDKLDSKVVLLDCLWLLPGVVPGVVALGVDFHNDTIYFSEKELEAIQNGERVRLRIPSIAPTS